MKTPARRNAVALSDSDSDSRLGELRMSSPVDVAVAQTPRAKRRASGRSKKKSQQTTDEEEDSDASVGHKTPIRASKRPSADRSNETNDDTSDDVRPSSVRRRSSVRKIIPQDEASDLEEDIDFLEGTELRASRTRGRPATSQRDQRRYKLEELKQKRLSKTSNLNPASESDQEDYEDNERRISRDLIAQEDSDKYESDFIDEDGDLGVDLAKEGVPLHLTGRANLKPLDYFKYVVEWMVHNKVDPAFERHDEVYTMSYTKLDDEVKGHANSTFSSAAWTPIFTKALQSRPILNMTDIGFRDAIASEGKCQACNRSGHPPSFQATFTGNAYNRDTLERSSKRHHADGNSNNDSQEDDSDKSSNSSDEADEPDQTFFVGRFCGGNAEIGHMLHHWRYDLNQEMLKWLADNGHLDADQVVQRESWSRNKRQRYANKIVDGMTESGEMKELYRKFKRDLEAARSAKVSFFFFFLAKLLPRLFGGGVFFAGDSGLTDLFFTAAEVLESSSLVTDTDLDTCNHYVSNRRGVFRMHACINMIWEELEGDLNYLEGWWCLSGKHWWAGRGPISSWKFGLFRAIIAYSRGPNNLKNM